MKPVRLVAEAREELLRETRFYEARRAGTGRRFREAVAQAFDLIQTFPAGGAPGPAGTRRAKVKGFPFTVIYQDRGDSLIVFAVAPDRRQPGYWSERAHPGDAREED